MLYPNQATRLLGRGPNSKARLERPASTIEGAAWAGAAAYLAGRLQVSGEEVGNTPGHERRKADMSPAAGAAMRAVLKEMGKEGGEAAAATRPLSRQQESQWTLLASQQASAAHIASVSKYSLPYTMPQCQAFGAGGGHRGICGDRSVARVTYYVLGEPRAR